ncbi:MAG: protein TonB [Polaromonas sp.]
MKLSGTLQMALGVSVLLHALLLAVRWVDPAQFDRIFQDTPLDVILVNSKANERPDTAQAIAQFSLAGGGDDDKVRPSSPLPPSALTDLGDPAEEVQRKIALMQAQQIQLLTQTQKQLAAMPPPMVARMAQDPAQAEREEKRISAENERPKKRHISPAAREEVYALYDDRLRRKIESQGTTAFPVLAGQKRYGELTMALTVNANGQLLASEVMRSSGNLTLDRQAQSIALRSAPFGRFTPEMQRQADQIVMISRFTFTRDDTLQTQMSQR